MQPDLAKLFGQTTKWTSGELIIELVNVDEEKAKFHINQHGESLFVELTYPTLNAISKFLAMVASTQVSHVYSCCLTD